MGQRVTSGQERTCVFVSLSLSLHVPHTHTPIVSSDGYASRSSPSATAVFVLTKNDPVAMQNKTQVVEGSQPSETRDKRGDKKHGVNARPCGRRYWSLSGSGL